MDTQTNASKLNVQYLDLLNQPLFTFIVNKKEYKCNSFAVTASKVIYELQNKDPNAKSYVYNFDDPNDDFRYICNFFNFQKILITTKNMNTILQIAEDLKIDIIINDVNNFIDTYEAIIEKSEIIDKIFGQLYNIDTLQVENVKNMIIDSIWVQSEENIQEFAAIILQVVRTSFQLQPYLIELLLLLDESADETNDLHLLLPFIKKHLLFTFHKSKLYCSFVYKMSQKGIISIDDIMKKIGEVFPEFSSEEKKDKSNTTTNNSFEYYKTRQLASDKYHKINQKNVVLWFFPELFELKHFPMKKLLESLNDKESHFVQLYFPNNLENFKKMRDSCQPSDEITQAIISDDIDTFQSIVTKRQIDINVSKIPFNLFEVFDNVIEKRLIDYAAKYGAVRCFKYLLLNHAKIGKNTLGFAVYGGNVEIIRIIDQNNPITTDDLNINNNNINMNAPWSNYTKSYEDDNYSNYFFDEKCLSNSIIPAIMMHRYDLFDWILEKKGANKKLSDSSLATLAKISALNGNIHSFVRLIDNGLILNDIKKQLLMYIEKTCMLGFYRFAQLLLSFDNDDKNELSRSDKSKHSSVVFGNLSIFKLFYDERQAYYKYTHFDSVLGTAIKKDYMKIVKYIIEDLIELNHAQLFAIFSQAIKLKSFEVVNYLESKINLNDFKTNNQYEFFGFNALLEAACSAGYFKLVKKITEIVVELNPSTIFSRHFITAASSGSEEICQYFIDKKVSFDTYDILQNYHSLDLGMGNVLISLINNSDPELKEKFSQIFLNEAIQKGNKNLVDLLLNKNSLNDQALFGAVKTHDIELVDKILNCQSKPSFINQISENGTALNIAVRNNDLAIVKRLLSVPGIDPNLYIKDKVTPLVSAIDNLNIEMINSILAFYGDKIQSQIWQINNSLVKLLLKLTEKKSKQVDKNILTVIDTLVQIKNIDLNFTCSDESFLSYACKNNEFELVQILLKSDSIDVNLYEPVNGNTPLLIALEAKNLEIAKLLISCPQTNINFKNNKLQTAFIIAVINKLVDLIPIIVNHEKFDPEDNNVDYAFYISDDSIPKELIKIESLDVNYTMILQSEPNNHFLGLYIKQKLFETSLIHAMIQKNYDKIDLILTHPSFDPVKSQLKRAIFESSSMNEIEIFKRLWKALNYDIQICSSNGECFFSYAVKHGSLEVIREILNKSDFKDNKKYFCKGFLNVTCRYKENEIIPLMKEIIEYDENHYHFIDFTQPLEDGESYFTEIPAFSSNIGEIAQFFLDHGADPNIPDKSGEYPLQYAILYNSADFIKVLLDSGKIDYSVRMNEIHETYLHLAAKSINLKIMDEFINRNLIDPDVTDDLGNKPSFYRDEVEKGYQEIINDIIEKTKYSSFPITKEFINAHFDLLVQFLSDFDSLADWDESCIEDLIDFFSENQ